MKTYTLAMLCAALFACSPLFATTITAITNGNWNTKGTWDLNRVPKDNDIVVIPSTRTVSLKNTPFAKNSRPLLEIYIYGTLDFSDAGSDKLYLDDGSKIQIYANGKIKTIAGSAEIIAIKNGNADNEVWDGTPVTILGDAYATASTFGFINAILPLKFLSFDVQRTNDDAVNIVWTTAEEVNTSYFDVEWYEQQNTTWKTVGVVFATSDAKLINKYTFAYSGLATSNNQFRIKQVDIDGKFTYSGIRSINNEKQPVSVRYDTRSSVVSFDGEKLAAGKLTMLLFDLSGNIRYRQSVENSAPTVRLPSMTPGVYFVQLKQNSDRLVTKRIIVH